MVVKTCQDLKLKLRYSCSSINEYKYHNTIHMTYRIMKYDKMGGGGSGYISCGFQVEGVIGFKICKRGVIQSLDDRSKFQPPRHLNNERFLMRRIFHKQTHMIA